MNIDAAGVPDRGEASMPFPLTADPSPSVGSGKCCASIQPNKGGSSVNLKRSIECDLVSASVDLRRSPSVVILVLIVLESTSGARASPPQELPFLRPHFRTTCGAEVSMAV